MTDLQLYTEQGLIERQVADQLALHVGRMHIHTVLSQLAVNQAAVVYTQAILQATQAVATAEAIKQVTYPNGMPQALAETCDRLTSDFLAGVTLFSHRTVAKQVSALENAPTNPTPDTPKRKRGLW